jgi:hypothetical protein
LAAAELQAQVLLRAGEQNLAALRRTIRRVLVRLDPARFEQRHQDAMTQRGVWADYRDDGTAELLAHTGADQVMRVMALLNQLAAEVVAGETRTADQRRVDALVALASGGLPVQGPRINVTVALSTLVGDDDLAAELDGGTLIPASLARRIAADPTGTWRRLITDPAGQVRDYGRTRYRPPADLAEYIQARDRHCRFPGLPP